MRIAFIHPDLGIGGAERMVVDAATCLQTAGHRVAIFTAHRDPQWCFEETLASLVRDPAAARRMGHAGRIHVAEQFSHRVFGARLEAILQGVIERRPTGRVRC